MQEVVDRILKGSITDAQHVLDESIETLQHAEYKIDHALRGLLYENEIISLALAKLVACSKELSLSFVSMRYINMCPKAVTLLGAILDIQKDEEVLNKAFHLVKINLLQACYRRSLISLLSEQQDFFMDNLDLFLRYYNDPYFYKAFEYIVTRIDYERFTDKQFFKICDMYLSKDERIEEVALAMLEYVYYYGERPIHYPLSEKLIEKHSIKIIRINARDLFALMQKYPSKIELLDISMPYISKNEVGIEHCVKYIENHLAYLDEKGNESTYYSMKLDLLSLICKFLEKFEDLSPFIHILEDNFNTELIKKLILKRCYKFGTGLPKVLDFVLKGMDYYSSLFLDKVYEIYENKEEINNKVMHLLENEVNLERHIAERYIRATLKDPFSVDHVPLKYTKVMIKHYIDQGDVFDLHIICQYENVRELDHMVVDLVIRSNKKSLVNKFWQIANALKSKYAIEKAWIYGDLDIRGIERAFNANRLTAPDDDVVPKFIKLYLEKDEIPNGKLLAYLYNNTGCKIHINLIKSVFKINTGKGSNSMAYQFFQMVLNLNEIDHKEELRTILVYFVLHIPGKFLYEGLAHAIERLGGSDECHALLSYTC